MAPTNPINKPIRPAAPKQESSGSSTGRESSASLSSRPRRLKRLKSVTQACHMCRRFKARCDGGRPSCFNCVAKGRECRYEGEAGQSLQTAMRARLESLEAIVAALQTKPPDQADELLNRIRSADDIDTVMLPRDQLSGGSSTSSSEGSAAPVDTALRTQIRVSSSSYLVSLVIPSAQTTVAAIQSFFSSSGKLFHVFSRDQIDNYYKSVFGLDGRPNINNTVALCGLAAVASVGIQYNPGDFDPESEVVFYNVARHYFSDVLEKQPLDAIKVATMLAMYNILCKATATLAYVEIGLNLSRRHSLQIRECRPPSMTEPEWVDYRRAWRTLLFLSSWLSSTLGYISGDDSAFEKLVPLAEVEVDHNSDISETVQAEMTKISLINAEILKMHLTQRELSAEAMDSIMKTLGDWHAQLPRRMLLANLVGQTLADEVRRSIYHAHLLYLGSLILVYRRIASQAARTIQFEQQKSGNGAETAILDQVTRSRAYDGIVAAKHSATILGLLLAEKGIFRRCWLVIFQAHTSCVVILHSIAQKQLHNLPPSSWAEEMRLARVCLDALEFCGELDPIASRFQIRLSGIYAKLQAVSERVINAALWADPDHFSSSTSASQLSTNEVARRRRTEEWVSLPPDFSPMDNSTFTCPPGVTPSSPDYLLTIPPGSDKNMAALSFSLLFALCRPWGDRKQPKVKEPSPGEDTCRGSIYPSSNANTTASYSTGTDYAQFEQSMMKDWERQNATTTADTSSGFFTTQPGMPAEWDLNTAHPFTWDTAGMIGYTRTDTTGSQPATACSIMTGFPISMPSSACFLGSEEPSGWKGAVDIIMVEEEEGVRAVEEDMEMESGAGFVNDGGVDSGVGDCVVVG